MSQSHACLCIVEEPEFGGWLLKDIRNDIIVASCSGPNRAEFLVSITPQNVYFVFLCLTFGVI